MGHMGHVRLPAEAGNLHPSNGLRPFLPRRALLVCGIGDASLPPKTGEARQGEKDRRSFGPPLGGGLLSDDGDTIVKVGKKWYFEDPNQADTHL